MSNTIKIKNSGTASNVPSTLEFGELAINYADGKLYYKNSSNSIVELSSGAGGSLSISDTPPSSPSAGDLWYESDTGSLYIYYDSQWVEVGVGSGGASDHGDLTGLGDDDHTQYLLADGTRTASSLTVSGNISVTGTVDGRDVAADGAKLDGIPDNPGVPVGTVIDWVGPSSGLATLASQGWISCDGSNISRTTYAALFALLGTTYGAGDGSTTFGLPDLRQRVTVGLGAGAAFDTVGETGGSADAVLVDHSHTASGGSHSHTSVSLSVSGTAASVAGTDYLYAGTYSSNVSSGSFSQPSTVNQIANHTHSVTGTATGTVGTTSSTHSHTISSEGESGTDKNYQPYMVVYKLIKF